MTNYNATPIYCGNRQIGEVQNGIFKKRIQFSKHALKRPPALALSLDSLFQAECNGADRVEIFDREQKRTYRATISHIREAGQLIERAGFEQQIALALSGWTVETRGGAIQLPPQEKPNKQDGRQLALFGGGI